MSSHPVPLGSVGAGDALGVALQHGLLAEGLHGRHGALGGSCIAVDVTTVHRRVTSHGLSPVDGTGATNPTIRLDSRKRRHDGEGARGGER